MIFYVYAYLDPRVCGPFQYGDFVFDYEPFYIGKGRGDRIKQKKRNLYFKHKYDKILSTGSVPILKIIKTRIFESEAFELEIMLIDTIGRSILNKGPLTNIATGGLGVSGRPLSEEHKFKLSTSLKGRIPWNDGKKLSEEHKRKIVRKGIENGFYGRRHTEKVKKIISDLMIERIEKNGAIRTGAILSCETKAKISKAHLGFKHSDETKRKMSESFKKKLPQSIEIRKKRSRTLMGHSVSEETRKKISDSLKNRNR